MNAQDYVIQKLAENGISQTEAKQAVRQCTQALLLSGVAGYYIGQLTGPTLLFLLANPASAPAAIGVGGAVALGSMFYQIGWGSGCSDLRQAVMKWNSGAFNQNSFQ